MLFLYPILHKKHNLNWLKHVDIYRVFFVITNTLNINLKHNRHNYWIFLSKIQ